jgi:hypothetical protein
VQVPDDRTFLLLLCLGVLFDVVLAVARGRTVWNLFEPPVSVVLESIDDLLSVWMDEVGPGLPQRVNDVVDKTDLKKI